ncbi:MAG: phospholipid-binding protein, partial [bacterium]
MPWILAHASEIDANGDGQLGREEMLTQAQAAFEAFDANKDGVLDAKEQAARPPRLAMGGFIGLHARELDEDGDGAIARAELLAVSTRMHAKSDGNGDGAIAGEELTAPARQQRGQE